jgi:hypothetical protein
MPFSPKPRPVSVPQRHHLVGHLIREVLKTVVTLIQKIVRILQQIFFSLFSCLRTPRNRDRTLALVLLLTWIAILLGNFVFRGNYVFEGNLLVQEMSFTYAGSDEKLFLDSIEHIQALAFHGALSQPLTLTGEFSSPDPALNQKLSQLQKLEIELPSPTSRVTFSPVNSVQKSQLTLLELRINPQSQVQQLAYTLKPQGLSFCLQSQSDESDDCWNQESLPTNFAQSVVGQIQLQLGQQPLMVNLEAVNIPKLGSQITSAELQFTPKIHELILPLLSPSEFFITLPKSSKADEWLRGDVEVKDVQFQKRDRTGNVQDEFIKSTILDGKVRLGGQTLELQPDQFLLVLPEKPRLPFSATSEIQKLRYIQINTQSPQGLRTLFSGHAAGIAAGLYSEFPVQKIEPSWLSQYLSDEAIAAILGFITAFTGIFFPRLFPEPPKDKDQS